jgi:hypothetical protein
MERTLEFFDKYLKNDLGDWRIKKIIDNLRNYYLVNSFNFILLV